MSHQQRKLSEAIRAAHYLKQILKSEVTTSEYSRGVYNGFELISSILLGRDAEIIAKDLEVKEIKKEVLNDV